MSAAPFFYLLGPERLISSSELPLWLGRIVKLYAEPEASFTPANPAPFVTFPVSTNTLSDISSILSGANNASLSAALGRSASAAASKSTSGGIDFSAKQIVSVRLQNHDKIFDALRRDEEVRKDLGRMLNPGGKPAFMIVAVLIWSDATFTNVHKLKSSLSGNASVPLAAAAAAATGVAVPGVDPKIKGETSSSTSRMVDGLSLGSHIFAVQYKAVRRPAWAIGRSFTPVLEDKGPRVEGVKRFAGTLGEDEAKSEPEPVEVEMDEEFVSWTDVLDDDDDDDDLDTEEIGELGFAFTKGAD